ncbi:MAG: hypothetical protein HY810_01720 [Candidatus Omnitrophica bacterium]|nr:hypothetical protein [Candidatus Omnitrophota bacterium]
MKNKYLLGKVKKGNVLLWVGLLFCVCGTIRAEQAQGTNTMLFERESDSISSQSGESEEFKTKYYIISKQLDQKEQLVIKKEEEITLLKKQLKDIQMRLLQMQDAIELLKKENGALSIQVKAAAENLRDKEQEYTKALRISEEQIKLLKKELDSFRAKMSQPSKEIELLQKEKDGLQIKMQSLQERMNEKETKYAQDLDLEKQQVAALNKQLEEVKKISKETPKEVDSLNNDNSRLVKEVEQVKEQLRENDKKYAKDIDAKKEEIAALEKKVNAREQELSELRKKMETAAASIKADTAEVNKYVDAVKNKLAEKDEKYKNDLGEKIEQINQMQEQLEETKQQLSRNLKEVEQIKLENEQFKNQVEKANSLLDDKKINYMEDLRIRNGQLKEKAEEADLIKKELNKSQNELAQIQRQIEVLDTENIELKSRAQTLQMQFDIKEQKYDKGLELKSGELKEKTAQILALKENLSNTQHQLTVKQEEVDSFKKNNAELDEQINILRKDILKQESEYERQLKSKTEELKEKMDKINSLRINLASKMELLIKKEEEISLLSKQAQKAQQ